MRFLLVTFYIGLIEALVSSKDWYLVNKQDKIPEFEPLRRGQELGVECIQRRIDDGEHKFDENKNIIFGKFPRCIEHNDYLKFKYNKNQDLTCTVVLTDELFHLFQLYIHEDSPFSCRLPITSNPTMSDHQEGLTVPMTFNFRGRVSESHLDIDTNMNVIVQTPQDTPTILSAVGWSSGTNFTKVIIGDHLPIRFSVRWIGSVSPKNQAKAQYNIPFTDGYYALPKSITYNHQKIYILISVLVGLISSVATYTVTYKYFLYKSKKFGFAVLNFDGGESGLNKKD